MLRFVLRLSALVATALGLVVGHAAAQAPIKIGVLLALGLARWHGRGSGTSNFIMLFPLVTPEIVMGVSLLLVFTQLFTFVPIGTFAQILGRETPIVASVDPARNFRPRFERFFKPLM